MIKKSKVVAFDLDGTLIDSAPDITEALNHVLSKNHLKRIKVASVRKLIGSGARALINDSFEKQGFIVENLNELTKTFLDKYRSCFKEKTRLYPNAKSVLHTLKKKKYDIVLVSNKPEYYCIELLKYFNIYKYFSYISGGDTFKYRKPDARHLKETIKKANILHYNCIFIGDSKFDLKCATNSNIPCILLSHGYSDINIYNLNAFKIVDDLEDIIYTVEDYFGKIL